MNRYSAGLLILLASLVGLAQGRSTSSGSSTSSSTSSSLAKGALIAIVVCVVVGVLVCCLCAFCLFRVLRRRKAAKTTTGDGLPMTSTEKPVGSTTGDPYGYTGGGYGGPHPPASAAHAPGNEHGNGAPPQDYNPQAQPYGGQQDYNNNDQNEYNAAYNPGQQQQTYGPPSGPPPGGMAMPVATHY